MATFSTNQVRQLYVAKSSGTVGPSAAVGTIEVKSDSGKTHLYFKYMGPGGQVRSDLIDIKSIVAAKATDADKMARDLAKYKLSLDANVNSGNPKAGQDYIVRIAFRNFVGLSEEDQYFKYGAVHAVTGMTAEQFYQILLASLEKNMSREASKLLNISLAGAKATVTMTTNAALVVTANEVGTAGNNLKFAIDSITAAAEKVTVATAAGVTTITVSLTAAKKSYADVIRLVAADAEASALITVTGTAATEAAVETAKALTTGSTTGIYIEEAEQPWYLGTMPVARLNFTVMPTTVNDGTEERIWGVVSTETSTSKIENGKEIADLEYFTMGERGDQYRMKGWPNIIPTKYVADPTVKYNVIDIQYAYQGSAEDIQKSEKSITLVIPKVGDTNATSNVLANTIIGAINTAVGSTLISTLAV